ncbi:hypothetical protein [Pseudomonas brassicacearum]|uniref:hypothetical protein n=1 Tax=Pseudomonas brassicacearum TaxID=930166 RepID=UPI00273370CB|nr:hypothetical protein [Pseudomonas brassicacearum]WLG68119.1 hypothetical protein PSH71_29805 [Pseudomonas brassicacearum]
MWAAFFQAFQQQLYKKLIELVGRCAFFIQFGIQADVDDERATGVYIGLIDGLAGADKADFLEVGVSNFSALRLRSRKLQIDRLWSRNG